MIHDYPPTNKRARNVFTSLFTPSRDRTRDDRSRSPPTESTSSKFQPKTKSRSRPPLPKSFDEPQHTSPGTIPTHYVYNETIHASYPARPHGPREPYTPTGNIGMAWPSSPMSPANTEDGRYSGRRHSTESYYSEPEAPTISPRVSHERRRSFAEYYEHYVQRTSETRRRYRGYKRGEIASTMIDPDVLRAGRAVFEPEPVPVQRPSYPTPPPVVHQPEPSARRTRHSYSHPVVERQYAATPVAARPVTSERSSKRPRAHSSPPPPMPTPPPPMPTYEGPRTRSTSRREAAAAAAHIQADDPPPSHRRHKKSRETPVVVQTVRPPQPAKVVHHHSAYHSGPGSAYYVGSDQVQPLFAQEGKNSRRRHNPDEHKYGSRRRRDNEEEEEERTRRKYEGYYERKRNLPTGKSLRRVRGFFLG